MVDFAPGMRTIIRDEEWMIKKIETNSLGNKTLYCVGVSPLVKDREAIFLADLEQIQVVDPAEVKLVADHSPFYKRALLYLESQWRQQIPTDSNLHIGHQAAMDLMPYQLDPAKLSLQRPRQRILIADTVGLGKTLEAGILMSELIARGKGKRILVVTVKSMMTQFQKEMWNRFTIPLVRLDSNRIQKIRASLPSNYNPFFYYDKTIISIDTLKRDVEYRTHLENAYWDIIVIDEAQNVAERGDHQAQRSRLAKLLADRSDTMIMLSATPHDGRAKSFASLMNMLDSTAIADPENYTPEDIKGLCIRRFKKDVKLHPIMSWVNDKASLLFKRNEAPVIGIPGKLIAGEIIYIVTGSIPNLKSTPLVDEWFGLLYQNGKFVKVLSMNEMVQKAGLSNSKIPNTNCITEAEISDAGALMQDVVAHAKAYLDEHYKRYQTEMSPLLDEEVDKLIALQERHKPRPMLL